MLKRFFIFATVLWLIGCSSHNASGVLEEVPNDAGEQEISKANPEIEKLNTLLNELGYKGVGLQYEEEKTIEQLHQIFSDAKTHDRKIQLIYTGLQMDYDERYESLTVGGDNPSAAVGFIEKKVPRRIK